MSGIPEADLAAGAAIAHDILERGLVVGYALQRELATVFVELLAEKRARDAVDEPPPPQAG